MLKLSTGALAGLFVLTAAGSANAACTATGYMKDGIDLTAALINPGRIDGQDVDATGCDVGVYFGPGKTGAIRSGSNIFGARYYGVLMNGAKVNVLDSVIRDIGDVPLSGAQRGWGIGCAIDSPQPSTALIRGNVIYNYQKNGIDLRGPNCGGTASAPVQIVGNQITGAGPTDIISQNGIVAGFGASDVFVSANNISGHSYTGVQEAASSGITILGGPCYSAPYQKNMTVTSNNLFGNDVALYLLNLTNSCSDAPGGPSQNNTVTNNDMSNFAVLNASGNGTGPYQVAISITDGRTKVADNNICGAGYWEKSEPAGGLVDLLDVAGSKNLVLTHNACFDRPDFKNASATMAAQDSLSASAAPSGKKAQAAP